MSKKISPRFETKENKKKEQVLASLTLTKVLPSNMNTTLKPHPAFTSAGL